MKQLSKMLFGLLLCFLFVGSVGLAMADDHPGDHPDEHHHIVKKKRRRHHKPMVHHDEHHDDHPGDHPMDDHH